ncbi:rRNA pseudouridine synthase [Candidatus Kuenenbacteria bacterium HGW-Kuenenbacteria-1]|uniref:Pseudouridine synthase n=1 Tax=Candidatus Kuenenbacteria bacterium HGW-Kuenenbacteria-1 TaxID=2013812 RepID=A0A2N1UN51_9BACT|nr:MAG: rRNA pseudouridine synthase [Candidatus Kuenenbacteria bacterium HGW-Kuenenbacteria-1]
MILRKFIASSGFCSRRKAKELIKTGIVRVNGQKVESSQTIEQGDIVEIGNEKLELPKEKIYIKLNKPIGYVCTNRKFKKEKNIFELLPLEANRLIIVGRLDKNSRGLVILTNDGNWSEHLTHPRYEREKEYQVKIFNDQFSIFKPKEIIEKFKKGIDIGEGDGIVKAKEVIYLGDNKFKIILTEGKKRQIRRMFKNINFLVDDLVRVRISDWELGNLAEAKWKFFKLKK